MSLQAKCNESLEVLDPNWGQGPALGTTRSFQKAKTVLAHLQPLPGTTVAQLHAMGSSIDCLAWFATDPGITEGDRVKWTRKGVVLIVTSTPVDRHGLGRVWSGTFQARREDNLGVNLKELLG